MRGGWVEGGFGTSFLSISGRTWFLTIYLWFYDSKLDEKFAFFSVPHRFPILVLRFLDPPSETCSSLQVPKKKAKLCPTMSFIGSGPRKTEGVGKLCCNSIWLLCGSLCSLKGKEDVFSLPSRPAPLPGSDLPNYHPYKEAKRPLTRAGLSPLLVLHPSTISSVSEL